MSDEPKQNNKINKRVKQVISVILSILIIYLIIVYSNIGFIAKYRTIYIETAMSTMTHQWLATAFFPESVVNNVVESINKQQEENIIGKNEIVAEEREEFVVEDIEHTKIESNQLEKEKFMHEYSEINIDTLPSDVDYSNLYLTEAANVYTIYGDKVYTIDTLNKLIIVNIESTGYKGKLAIIKDASRVKLAESKASNRGEFVNDIVAREGILGINASGFVDEEGKGNGGTPVGLVKINGEIKNQPIKTGYWFIVGFDYSNNLHIGTEVDIEILRDAVQFRPALIVDGEKRVEGSYGWGIQPRSVIGQTKEQDVLMLVIDGRKPEHSIGATVGDCADIMLKYGAIQAINLDGGSSSALSYNGKTINIPSTSSGNKDGRYVPNAWVVETIQEVKNITEVN